MLVAFDRLPWVALIILLRDLLLIGGYKLVVPRGYDFEVSRLGKIADMGALCLDRPRARHRERHLVADRLLLDQPDACGDRGRAVRPEGAAHSSTVTAVCDSSAMTAAVTAADIITLTGRERGRRGEFHYLGAAGGPCGFRRGSGGRGSRSCCSTSPTSAAASTACASPPSLPISRRSSRYAGAGIAVGVAPHSVRACSRASSRRSALYATPRRASTPHPRRRAAREIQECLEEHGCRPIELLADTGYLRRHTRPSSTRRTRTTRSSISSPPRERAICACPTRPSRSRRRLSARRRGSRPLDPTLRRVGLEHANRPSRGAPRARGDRAPPDRPPWDPPLRRNCSRSGRTRVPEPCTSRHGRGSRSTRSTARSPASRPSMSRQR